MQRVASFMTNDCLGTKEDHDALVNKLLLFCTNGSVPENKKCVSDALKANNIACKAFKAYNAYLEHKTFIQLEQFGSLVENNTNIPHILSKDLSEDQLLSKIAEIKTTKSALQTVLHKFKLWKEIDKWVNDSSHDYSIGRTIFFSAKISKDIDDFAFLIKNNKVLVEVARQIPVDDDLQEFYWAIHTIPLAESLAGSFNTWTELKQSFGEYNENLKVNEVITTYEGHIDADEFYEFRKDLILQLSLQQMTI